MFYKLVSLSEVFFIQIVLAAHQDRVKANDQKDEVDEEWPCNEPDNVEP